MSQKYGSDIRDQFQHFMLLHLQLNIGFEWLATHCTLLLFSVKHPYFFQKWGLYMLAWIIAYQLGASLCTRPRRITTKRTKVESGGRSPFTVSNDTAVCDILEFWGASLSRLILIKPVSCVCICSKSLQQLVIYLLSCGRRLMVCFTCAAVVRMFFDMKLW